MGGYVRKGHILLFLYALNHHIVPFRVTIKIKRSLECNVWCLFYGKDLLEICLQILYFRIAIDGESFVKDASLEGNTSPFA